MFSSPCGEMCYRSFGFQFRIKMRLSQGFHPLAGKSVTEVNCKNTKLETPICFHPLAGKSVTEDLGNGGIRGMGFRLQIDAPPKLWCDRTHDRLKLEPQTQTGYGIDAARRSYSVFKVRWGVHRFRKLHRFQWSEHITQIGILTRSL